MFLPKEDMGTHELAASLKPFSIAGIKFDGIACPTITFSNSNFVGDPAGSGSIYLQCTNR
jgi:hypothetical protein